MPTRDDLRWFKDTFHEPIERALAGTPFTLDLVTAIAAQETGHIWGPLHGRLPLDELLAICVGDTLDADKGRRAFPRTRGDLVGVPNGERMFAVARDALVRMAAHVPSFAGVARRPHKFCHGFGIFQLDLQFFREDPDYFLERRWHRFDVCLANCVRELRAKLKPLGFGSRTTLSDLEQVHVAIAYNAGTFKPGKGLKQGFFDGTQFYGERIFDFLRLAQTVGPSPVAGLPAPAPGVAPVAPAPAPTASGPLLEVDVKEAPLRLRSEPTIDKSAPGRNVIAHLPDGHRVRRLSPTAINGFVKVETTLNGGLFRGFAASQFLIPVAAGNGAGATLAVVVPAAAPPTGGIIEVLAPRTAGSITRRSSPATAHSLNEPDQPVREGMTPAELRDDLTAIIDHLAVDRVSHKRYQPRNGATFCNIYAHDYCHLAGVYLPRVWWTPDALERLARGEQVTPRLGSTIDEQRANDLFRWLNAFGPRFGWRRAGTLTELQTEVNVGAVGLVIARRKLEGKSGHVAMVVPEAGDRAARRSSGGEVIAPLQSQAGSRNFRFATGTASWWTGEQFADSAFWLHA
jgi:hypothetical protein